MAEQRRSESEAGYHYYTKYLSCPRSWYIKYVLGLLPDKTPRALPFGGAVHHALGEFCNSKHSSKELLLRAFDQYMLDSRDEYASTDEYLDDLKQRGPLLLGGWYDSLGVDFHQHYRVLESEQQWEVPLYSGDIITVRVDQIVHQLATGFNFILETKTSSWSQVGAAEGVIEADQATTYLLAAERVRPNLRIQGVIPQILYNRGSVVKCNWFEVIYRSQEELRDWEDQLVGLIQEVSAKRAAVGKVPLGQLFPRFPAGCSYAHKCSYPHVCRQPPTDGTVPRGYRKDES